MFKNKIKILLAFIFSNIFLIFNNISTIKAVDLGPITIKVTVLPQASTSGQQSFYTVNLASTDCMYDLERELKHNGALNGSPVEFILNNQKLAPALSFAFQNVQNNDSIIVAHKSLTNFAPIEPRMFVVNRHKLCSEVTAKKRDASLMKRFCRPIKKMSANAEPITYGQFVNPPTKLYPTPSSISTEPLPLLDFNETGQIICHLEGDYSTCTIKKINESVFLHEYRVSPFTMFSDRSIENINRLICSIFFKEVTINEKATSIPWLKRGDQYIKKIKLESIKDTLCKLTGYKPKKRPVIVDDLLVCICDIFLECGQIISNNSIKLRSWHD